MKYLCLLGFFIAKTWAGLPVAEVVLVKGAATVLRPGAHLAYQIKIGDKILEDSSLVTHDKAFIRLKFNDETLVNLGPNSKMIVAEFRPNQAGVIDLLRGRLRTSVQKDESKQKNKFYIKTRTAAMAVRGTEFQTIYNPENKNTSLLTYQGSVALVKINEDEMAKNVEVKEVSGQVEKEVKVVKTAYAYDTAEGLEQVIEAHKTTAVIAQAGQYAGSVPGLSRPTIPVKISPEQLESLYKNETLQEKASGEKVKISTDKMEKTLVQAAQTAPAEGYFNRKTNEYAPRSGGYVDTKSGLYVPPAADSIYDQDKGVYVAKNIGVVDAESGQYVPPAGIRLDAQKGFVVYQDVNNDDLLAQAELLNANIKSDIVLASGLDDFHALERSELFTSHDILLSYKTYAEELNYTEDSVRGARAFKANSAYELKLDWEQEGTQKWKTHAQFALKKVKYNDLEGESLRHIQGSTHLFSMGAGAKYLLSNYWTAKADFLIDQNFFINYDSASTQLSKVALTQFSLGLDWIFWEKKRWSSNVGAALLMNTSKQTGALKVLSGIGSEVNLNLNYWWGNRLRSVAGAVMTSKTNKSEGSGFTATSSREQLGFHLALQYHY